MPFPLRRRTDAPDLELTAEHLAIVEPRRGRIDWDAFDPRAWTDSARRAAAEDWRARARTEYCSLAFFTQMALQAQELGAPLDWAGAFARMIADEVRHAELSARMAEALGACEPATIDPADLCLPRVGTTARGRLLYSVVTTFCIGETLSGRMFRRCLRAATIPLARAVVRVILDDETFHGQFGWEIAALLMRPGDDALAGERLVLAQSLPEIFAQYRHACSADPGEAWARGEPEADVDPNFGTLTRAGYGRAFFDGMREDVVPGLVAIGIPEAEDAWRSVLGTR